MGAEIDRLGGVAPHVLRELEGAGDLRGALLMRFVVTPHPRVDLFVAEALPESLSHLEEREPEVERPAREAPHRIREADAPLLARAGGEVLF